MNIRGVKHEGLRRLLEADEVARLPAQSIERIRNILAFLQDMKDVAELKAMPGWHLHQLSGDRKGTLSLTVTRNWRITFRVDEDENEIIDLDYEDYH